MILEVVTCPKHATPMYSRRYVLVALHRHAQVVYDLCSLFLGLLLLLCRHWGSLNSATRVSRGTRCFERRWRDHGWGEKGGRVWRWRYSTRGQYVACPGIDKYEKHLYKAPKSPRCVVWRPHGLTGRCCCKLPRFVLCDGWQRDIAVLASQVSPTGTAPPRSMSCECHPPLCCCCCHCCC